MYKRPDEYIGLQGVLIRYQGLQKLLSWRTTREENWLRLLLAGVCAQRMTSLWGHCLCHILHCSPCYCLCSNCIAQYYIALYCLWYCLGIGFGPNLDRISSLLLKGHTWELCEWKCKLCSLHLYSKNWEQSQIKWRLHREEGVWKKWISPFPSLEVQKLLHDTFCKKYHEVKWIRILLPEMWSEVKQAEPGEGYKVGKAKWVF